MTKNPRPHDQRRADGDSGGGAEVRIGDDGVEKIAREKEREEKKEKREKARSFYDEASISLSFCEEKREKPRRRRGEEERGRPYLRKKPRSFYKEANGKGQKLTLKRPKCPYTDKGGTVNRG
ncbi:hypothetical protein L484_019855 [Morus notabilis]|uniref:Uncharacterized protein n=1 Tax=Morus notabilis TaxID=981085 RepID=W9SHT5_9ROSA|nr:hypothetical protein L484_019855 [Morus notabilis]